MYVVTVEFLVKEACIDLFLPVMRKQAENSLTLEADCHQFDVAISESNPCLVFLYELYTDKAAFDLHLASNHFTTFNSEVSDWVADKKVGNWMLSGGKSL